MGSDGSFMKLREEHHPPVGYSRLQKLTGLGQAALFPTGTGSWASLAFTHSSQVDFKCAHGFLKDCFIFSDATANGFIDSSFHWGHMRWLLFSHWLRPTTISTFLAGAQGDLRGAKLIAFQAQLQKGSQNLAVCSPSGWGAEECSAEPRRWLTCEQLP